MKLQQVAAIEVERNGGRVYISTILAGIDAGNGLLTRDIRCGYLNSKASHAVAVLQASDLLLQVVGSAYPGPGKSIISFAWSPFAVEQNVILVGASDRAGLGTGIERLLELTLAD